ncbi:MAG TPA: prepilin peptidase [Xanthobacteraceae bacterium]|jgi:prepilin peptidase CpaA|nr:prepilin peptidase [Xanthobacteraceae bacterium]
MTTVIALVLFPAAMAYAASSDLLTMTISNKVSLVLLGGFLLLALATGMSAHQMTTHAGAALIVLAAGFAMFARGWIGGGDAKLAAASALWLGWAHLLDYVLYASLLGGGLTLLLLEFRKWPLPAPVRGQDWVERLHDREGGVPYGIALAAAALLIYPSTVWMTAGGG